MSVLISLIISYGVGMIPFSQFILGVGYHRRMARYRGIAGRRLLGVVIDCSKACWPPLLG